MRLTGFFTVSLPIISIIPSTSAWGTLGHEAVADIAASFLKPATTSFCQNLLSDTTANYLASVSTWADTFRYTSAGSFSKAFHYIDARDDPPTTCVVDYARDCGGGGCVVAAIANYTMRVKDQTLSREQRFQALKFLIHFIGDIHQPLHDENLDIGGNTIQVTFAGLASNVHHIWDTEMPEKLRGISSLPNAQSWATTLTGRIRTGDYVNASKNWLTRLSLTDSISTGMVWARNANAYVCSTVLAGGVSAVNGQELSGRYYTAAVPVIELQVAKGEIFFFKRRPKVVL